MRFGLGSGGLLVNEFNVTSVICPNCGKKLLGLINGKGESKLECSRCKVKVFSRTITPKKKLLEVTAR